MQTDLKQLKRYIDIWGIFYQSIELWTFRTPSPSNKIIKILIIVRTNDPVLPSGGIVTNETIEAAIIVKY